jgi:NAD(P)-dependent dehydrogenase (short-subunit alcohol dehydrogenase family)
MKKRLVLITGSTGGVGNAAALACAEAGFTVVATMREPERGKALLEALAERSLTCHLEQLDVTSPLVGDKVRELVLKYGPFEGLVNNAGIAILGAFEEQSDDDLRVQFETNVFGVMAVIRALLPSMRAAGHGRIINVSSIAGRVGVPTLSLYAASRFALSGFSDALRHELKPFGIHVCVVEPGTFNRGILGADQRRGADVATAGPYAQLTETAEKLLAEALQKAPGPEQVGATIAELLDEPSPPFRTVVGGSARAVAALHDALPDGVFSAGLRMLMGLS